MGREVAVLFLFVLAGLLNMVSWFITRKIFQKKFNIQVGAVVLIGLITSLLGSLARFIGDFFIFFGLKIFMEVVVVRWKLSWKETIKSILVSNLCLVVILLVLLGISFLIEYYYF